MTKVVIRGESVYKCSVCGRKKRVPTNTRGLDVLNNCTITASCRGKLSKVTIPTEILNTPTIVPAVPGVLDWYQHELLYTHTQVITSSAWTIKHNMGNVPHTHVFVNRLIDGLTALVEIDPIDTVIIDANTINLIFAQEESGIAQLISLTSQNVTNPSFTIASTSTTVSNTQISNNSGMITIATLNQDPSINISLRYVITGQLPVDIVYTNIDNQQPLTSPWVGISQAVINGKTYTVRSVDIIGHPNAVDFFLVGQIPPQGGSLYVTRINEVAPVYDDVLILMANSPYKASDKIEDRIVYFGRETASSAGVLYSFGKVYAAPSAISNIYPYVTVV